MLYFVPVPIGNLGDITLRGLEILKKSEVVFCEDSRVTGQLFRLLEIENKPRFVNLTKSHKFNERQVLEVFEKLEKVGCHSEQSEESVGAKQYDRVVLETKQKNTSPTIADTPQEGDSSYHIKIDEIALENEFVVSVVTDAGTPGISDPGYEIIKLAQEKGLAYTVLPGPAALIPAVVSSGLVSKEFTFFGFLPTKKGRQKAWKKIAASEFPVVLYESNHRISKFVGECKEYLEPEKKICICREISKKFEEVWVGCVGDFEDLEIKEKGEFVVVIG